MEYKAQIESHQNCHSFQLPLPKKGKKKTEHETYFVVVTYLTYEVQERLVHVGPQLGRRLNEVTSELPSDVVALCM